MSTVRTERDGRVLTVTLDNPPHNFMNGAMVLELDRLTQGLERDAAVGAVVITGAPQDVFITHFDVSEIPAGSGIGPTTARTGLRLIHDLILRMNRMDKVFVAAINGLALGAGFELALACDVRLMAKGEQHRIGVLEACLGIIPGAGGTQLLTRSIGASRALALMLEAKPLTPQEAQDLGLVHELVDGDELLAAAQELAARVARRSRLSVGALKRAVYDGSSLPLEDGLRMERKGFVAAARSPEARRGMNAYLEQLEENGRAPLADEELCAAWRDGTAADLVS
jgi:enoyl-CoA hydratase